MIPWIPVTAVDFMRLEYIVNAVANQHEVASLFFSALDRRVVIHDPDMSAGAYTIPFPDLVNIIEDNITALSAGGYRPPDMEPTRHWLGEDSDAPFLSYRDVNRWYVSSEQLAALIEAISKRLLITGTFTAGSNRTRQLIRSV